MIKVSDKKYREISQYVDDLKRRLLEKSISFIEFKQVTGTLIGHKKLETFINVYEELEKVLEENFSNYHIDKDVKLRFTSCVVDMETDRFNRELKWYTLSLNTTQKDVVSYLKETDKYLELTLINALKEIIRGIKSNFFNKKDIRLVIMLSTIDKYGNKCVLDVKKSDRAFNIQVCSASSERIWSDGRMFSHK